MDIANTWAMVEAAPLISQVIESITVAALNTFFFPTLSLNFPIIIIVKAVTNVVTELNTPKLKYSFIIAKINIGQNTVSAISLTPDEAKTMLSLVFIWDIIFLIVIFDGTCWSFDRNKGVIEPNNKTEDMINKVVKLETVKIKPPITGPATAINNEEAYHILTS